MAASSLEPARALSSQFLLARPEGRSGCSCARSNLKDAFPRRGAPRIFGSVSSVANSPFSWEKSSPHGTNFSRNNGGTTSPSKDFRILQRCQGGGLSRRARRICTTRSTLIEPGEILYAVSAGETRRVTPWRVIEDIATEFEFLADSRSRMRELLKHASELPRLASEEQTRENRVMGCTAQVWMVVSLEENGSIRLQGDSDSEISRGLCAIVVKCFSGLPAEEILKIDVHSVLERLSPVLGGFMQEASRVNGLYSMLQAMQVRVRAIHEPLSAEPFPTLLIRNDGTIEAEGEFAISQAQYLNPEPSAVDELVSLLQSKKIGVVAHFYMDPQVQGVLVAAKKQWPHIHISDSLVMADSALKMAQAGCEAITVLGVDFMAENVRAILDKGGRTDVPVYRMSNLTIGCSLAEAAESEAYMNFLELASQTPKSMHVIYINTSLDTKARAHSLLPTITCTSSNVVQTVLQAFSQVPELTLWYGPDTYMGGNLVELLTQLSQLSDEEISAVHPSHNRDTLSNLLPRLHFFQDGACIVHDLFGRDLVDRVRKGYGDAYQTAHFEVPGEMFALAMEARKRGHGTVGSTQNILDFIRSRTREAVNREFDECLQFVLGTEAGMITAIVQAVQEELAKGRESGKKGDVQVKIVLPVDNSAISATEKSNPKLGESSSLSQLAVVPGVSSGEGCSISGGCASCPYMKMNSLTALLKVCRLVGSEGEVFLSNFAPNTFSDSLIDGRTIADIGCDPILHMRHFQTQGKFSDELVADICTRHA